MTQLFANNARTTVGLALGAGDVSLTVATSRGAIFPTITGGDFFLVTLESTLAREIVKVTARVGDVFTIVRAQEGTTGTAFSVGDTVELRLTSGSLGVLQTSIAAKAPSASPTFTGTVTIPTPSANDNSTKAASTAYVDTAGALKANLASPTLTGTPAAPTATGGTNTTQIATTAFVTAAVGGVTSGVSSVFGRAGAVVKAGGDYAVADVTGAAPLASPTLTGTPVAPTAAYGTNTTQLATTAMVQAAVATRIADGNTSATKTVDFSTANVRQETLNAATVTFTFTAPPTGSVVILECSQDSGGGRLVTWPASVHWSGGTAPTLSAGASKVDLFTFYYNGTTYFGVTSGLNYTA